MRVATEHIYEPLDEQAGLYRLAIPAGSEVSEEDAKRLGVKKAQTAEVESDEEITELLAEPKTRKSS